MRYEIDLIRRSAQVLGACLLVLLLANRVWANQGDTAPWLWSLGLFGVPTVLALVNMWVTSTSLRGKVSTERAERAEDRIERLERHVEECETDRLRLQRELMQRLIDEREARRQHDEK